MGFPPFYDANEKKLRKKILLSSYDFKPKYWSGVSSSAKDFISNLLLHHAEKRFSCDQALNHSWIQECHINSTTNYLPKSIEHLQKFKVKYHLKSIVNMIIAANRIRSGSSSSSPVQSPQRTPLRSFDAIEDGELSLLIKNPTSPVKSKSSTSESSNCSGGSE